MRLTRPRSPGDLAPNPGLRPQTTATTGSSPNQPPERPHQHQQPTPPPLTSPGPSWMTLGHANPDLVSFCIHHMPPMTRSNRTAASVRFCRYWEHGSASQARNPPACRTPRGPRDRSINRLAVLAVAATATAATVAAAATATVFNNTTTT